MKSIMFNVGTCLIALILVGPVRAENLQHVQQLLETNSCQGCDLSGADLQNTHLIGADLRDANLTDANLEEANLEGADLSRANLENANLNQTCLLYTSPSPRDA